MASPAFFGAHKWVELLYKPGRCRGPPKRGQNHKWPHHPYVVGAPQLGRIALSTLRSKGVPRKGDKIRKGYLTRAFTGAHKWAELLHKPLRFSGVPQKGNKIRSGSITPTLSGARKWAAWLRKPVRFRWSLQKGTKSQVTTSCLPCHGATSGRTRYVHHFVLRGPKKRGQNQKWLRHHGLVVCSQVGGLATYTTPFSGVPTKGEDKIRSGYLNPAISGAHGWTELPRNPCILGGPRKGDKIRSGYLTPTLSGSHKWAELLCHPCVIGAP